MWLFKDFCSTASSWRWKQKWLTLWTLCPRLYFYFLTAALMFLGSCSTHPMNTAGSPSSSSDRAPSPHGRWQSSFSRFNTAHATKKGGLRGVRACPRNQMAMNDLSLGFKRFIKEGVKGPVENGEMDERRTKKRGKMNESRQLSHLASDWIIRYCYSCGASCCALPQAMCKSWMTVKKDSDKLMDFCEGA